MRKRGWWPWPRYSILRQHPSPLPDSPSLSPQPTTPHSLTTSYWDQDRKPGQDQGSFIDVKICFGILSHMYNILPDPPSLSPRSLTTSYWDQDQDCDHSHWHFLFSILSIELSSSSPVHFRILKDFKSILDYGSLQLTLEIAWSCICVFKFVWHVFIMTLCTRTWSIDLDSVFLYLYLIDRFWINVLPPFPAWRCCQDAGVSTTVIENWRLASQDGQQSWEIHFWHIFDMDLFTKIDQQKFKRSVNLLLKISTYLN